MSETSRSGMKYGIPFPLAEISRASTDANPPSPGHPSRSMEQPGKPTTKLYPPGAWEEAPGPPVISGHFSIASCPYIRYLRTAPFRIRSYSSETKKRKALLTYLDSGKSALTDFQDHAGAHSELLIGIQQFFTVNSYRALLDQPACFTVTACKTRRQGA